MKRLAFIILYFPFVVFPQSLNLLPDPSIEDTIVCDIQYPFENLRYWYDPTESRPQAIVYCNQGLSVGISNPRSGYGAALVYLYYTSTTPPEQREYIASSLKKNLKTNTKYCVDFYTKPVKPSKYGCNSLGVYFGVGHQYYNTYVIPPVVPQSDTLLTQPITDTAFSYWFHYVDIYTATGNETDIMIGNFRPDSQISYPIIDSSASIWNGATFIFDDVSLYEMSIDAGLDALTCPANLITTIGEVNSDTLFKNYYWYDAGGVLIDSINSQITVQPTSNTFYIEEKRMCGQSLWDTVYVNVDTVCPPDPPTPEIELIVPNVFSPNDDGINDVWQLQIDEQRTKEYSCIIYNRYGLKMFESNSQKESWSGRTTSGVKCSEGVYYYVVEFTNSKEERETHRGYISLFR